MDKNLLNQEVRVNLILNLGLKSFNSTFKVGHWFYIIKPMRYWAERETSEKGSLIGYLDWCYNQLQIPVTPETVELKYKAQQRLSKWFDRTFERYDNHHLDNGDMF